MELSDKQLEHLAKTAYTSLPLYRADWSETGEAIRADFRAMTQAIIAAYEEPSRLDDALANTLDGLRVVNINTNGMNYFPFVCGLLVGLLSTIVEEPQLTESQLEQIKQIIVLVWQHGKAGMPYE